MSDDATHPEQADDDEVRFTEDGKRIVDGAPLEVYRKLAEVSIALEKIEKQGDSGQGWAYVRAEDVLQAIRDNMNAVGLLCLPAADNIHRSSAGMTTVGLRYKLVDVATGQFEEREWRGTGAGEKGLYRGYTGGLKYFLLDLFQIPTFDDPEKPAEKPAGDGRPPLRDVSAPMLPDQEREQLAAALEAAGVAEGDLNTVDGWARTWTQTDYSRWMELLTSPESAERTPAIIVATAHGYQQGAAAA